MEEMRIEKFSSKNEEVDIIEKSLRKLIKYSLGHNSKYERIIDSNLLKFTLEEDYNDLNAKAKEALLVFCAKKAGIEKIGEDKSKLIRAFSNPNFTTIFNSIIVETLESIILASRPEAIYRLANVSTVGVGDSDTWEIDPKGLPVAQRVSYTTNVTFNNSYARSSITIKPQPYAIGFDLDYIRIIANDYDIGRELARIAAAFIFAQLKLIVESIFAVANLNNTPFYQAAWNVAAYVQMAEDIQMLNGGSPVTAYGTRVAFNKMGTLATTNYGFQSQDEMIREGFIGRAYGIDNVILEQFTDLNIPFTNANATSLRTIPNDRVVLLSSVNDRPVKLVRENFIHFKVKDQNEGAQYKYSYRYFMSFDAAIATQANYGIQSVAQ